MALLIKSAINYSRLTARAKHLIVPQLNVAFSACSTYSTKPSVANMLEHEVVPDVIAVAPSDKIEVNFIFIFIPIYIFIAETFKTMSTLCIVHTKYLFLFPLILSRLD